MTRLQALIRDLRKQKKISIEAYRRFETDFGDLDGRESIYRVREARCVFDTLQPRKNLGRKTQSEHGERSEALLALKRKDSTGSDVTSAANLDASSPNGALSEFLSIVVSCT